MHPHAVFVLVRIEELGVVRVRESELPHAAGIGVGVDVLELDLIATLAADLGPQIVHVGMYRAGRCDSFSLIVGCPLIDFFLDDFTFFISSDRLTLRFNRLCSTS